MRSFFPNSPKVLSSTLLVASGALAALLALWASDAQGQDCLTCHGQIAKGKVVHAAVGMGCATCHSDIDATAVPHKKTGRIAKGLSAEPPELCYGCHDKAKFSKKKVHAALGMGCGVCHNPHSSENEKLLTSPMPGLCEGCHDKKLFSGKGHVHAPVAGGMCASCHSPHSAELPKLLLSEPPELCYGCHDKTRFAGKTVHAPVGIGMCMSCHQPHQSANEKLLTSVQPDLCYSCHEKAEFSKKYVHAPVAGGVCLECHKPHSSDEMALLKDDPVAVCFGCHPKVRKTPHAVAGFQQVGHPLGVVRKGQKPVDDPARPGKRFYCGSCHNPHASDNAVLFRYQGSSSMELCVNCHKM